MRGAKFETRTLSYEAALAAGVSKLRHIVIKKLRQRATKPALQPRRGSRWLSMRKMDVATPTTMPASTADAVTRFQ
jgi:hypothetical protein